MAASRRLVWSADARNDLSDIYVYLAVHSSRTIADRRARDIENAARRLLQWPLMGRPRPELRRDLRSWAVPPEIIFYYVTDVTIEIVRVIDGRRDIGGIFGVE